MRGHPKFIFNKGRRGWGLDALRLYAPEYRGRFRLQWVAVQRDRLVWSSDADCDINALLSSAMDDAERERFDARWQELDLDDSWLPVPLHPWQWQQNCHSFPSRSSHAVKWWSWVSSAMSIWRSSPCAR